MLHFCIRANEVHHPLMIPVHHTAPSHLQACIAHNRYKKLTIVQRRSTS